VVETHKAIYLFEFKIGATDAEAALAQIEERGYAEKYRKSGKHIHLIGARFGMDEREIVEWQVKSLGGE
jgi:hypothetical protein